MKNLILICTLSLLFSGCASTQLESPRWEYKVFVLNPFENGLLGRTMNEIADEVEARRKRILQDYGEDGWELVSVEENIFYFKRPLSE
ncbi:DUF4177 domain-containing protein [Alteromonas gilva]|uniref:DUF4177 domain-containing protein n=1 Tax=Alteromonas gilva TaxID=2987522 RepID=A0ABT5KX86_9ALTE|nr:DUF4177 domain-containing protein [Alteromonas gilva]MDC8829366.1 DUF4177 domain-containing protein [Alteromonas gilva]